MSGEGNIEDTVNVYRALGRIEGAQNAFLDKMDGIVESLSSHTAADDRHFTELHAVILAKNKDQDGKIEALENDANRAKGAGIVILAMLGSLATFVGGAVMAVFGGWVKIKFS